MTTTIARLRWRCRRGTRELDQLLGHWLEHRYATATADTQAAFAALLDHQDPDLWDWMLGNGQAADPAQQAIIDEIRAEHRV